MIGFTLCSNNYLALARSLVASWVVHHPDDPFVIGLVDKRDPAINYTLPGRAEVIEVANIGIPDFEELTGKYDITELNTAVKPYYFDFLFKDRAQDKIIYLDPDILLFKPLRMVEDLLSSHSLIVTPHICSPINEELGPTDYHLLRTGIFNLGFIAIRHGPQTLSFLAWWQDKMRNFAYRRDAEGLFYDQIWMNYLPAFYADCHVLRDIGHNVANWNLHERLISSAHDEYRINGSIELVFFHFSHYKIDQPNTIASYNLRYTFESRPDIKPLYDLFRANVLSHGHNILKSKPCFYKYDGRARHFGRDSESPALGLTGNEKRIKKMITAFPLVHRLIHKLARCL